MTQGHSRDTTVQDALCSYENLFNGTAQDRCAYAFLQSRTMFFQLSKLLMITDYWTNNMFHAFVLNAVDSSRNTLQLSSNYAAISGEDKLNPGLSEPSKLDVITGGRKKESCTLTRIER